MSAMSSHEKPNRGETDVWLTPPHIVRALGEFDMDPCAHPGWITAKEHLFDPSGLLTKWLGRVWLNPPYSQNTAFMARMALHGNGVALVFARTETNWFHHYVWAAADAVFFFEGRIRFYRMDGSVGGNAGAPSCLVAYGQGNVDAIVAAQNSNALNGKLVLLGNLERCRA